VDARTGAREAASTGLVELTFRLHGRVSSLLARDARQHRLTPSEAAALLALAHGRMSISRVAEATGIRPNGASVLVERLRERGLVRRERDARDNRVVTVELTPHGRAVAAELDARAREQLEIMLSPLSSPEQAQLLSLLARIVETGVRTAQSP